MRKILIAALSALVMSGLSGASASAQMLTPQQQQAQFALRQQNAYYNQQLRLQRQGAEFGLAGEALALLLRPRYPRGMYGYCSYGEQPMLRYGRLYCPQSQEYMMLPSGFNRAPVTVSDGPGCTKTTWFEGNVMKWHRHCEVTHHREWHHYEEHHQSVARSDPPRHVHDVHADPDNRDNVPPDWQVTR